MRRGALTLCYHQNLVVWRDFRMGANTSVFGARVSDGGKVRNLRGFALTTAQDQQFRPRTAGAAGRFAAVWQDHRHGDWEIYGARLLKPTGANPDKNGLLVSGAAPLQQNPRALARGAGLEAIWQRQAGAEDQLEADLRGVPLSSGGRPHGGGAFSLAAPCRTDVVPVSVNLGSRALAAWAALTPGAGWVLARRYGPGGELAEGVALRLGSGEIMLRMGQRLVGAASGGRALLAAGLAGAHGLQRYVLQR